MSTNISGRESPITQFLMDEGVPQDSIPNVRAYIKHETSQLQGQLNTWKGFAEEAEDLIFQKDSEITALKQNISSIERQLTQAKKVTRDLEGEKENLEAEITELRQLPKTSQTESSLKEALSALKICENDLASSRSEIKSLNFKYAQSQKSLDTLTAELQNTTAFLSSKVDDLTEEVSSLKREARENEAEIRSLQSQLKDQQDQEDLNKPVQKDSGKGNSLASEIDAATKQEQMLKAALSANDELKIQQTSIAQQLSQSQAYAAKMKNTALGCAVVIAAFVMRSFF